MNNAGRFNTAIVSNVLYSNTTGGLNAASGWNALFSNPTGLANTTTGASALCSNTIGHNETANGQNAMSKNTAGSFNVALGDNAGLNLTGSNNIEIGNRACGRGQHNSYRQTRNAWILDLIVHRPDLAIYDDGLKWDSVF